MSLETFIRTMPNNVVLRSAMGNKPSIFVRHPKQNSIEFDSVLPDHPHPAFLHGNDADSAVLIGKYSNHLDNNADVPCSLPNTNPVGVGLGYNNIISMTSAFGGNVRPFTIADHGLVVLIAHKNRLSPHGNNNGKYACADFRSGTAWSTTATNVSVGDVRVFEGWTYRCLKAHTISDSLKPVDSPAYWKKMNKVGGIPAEDDRTIMGNAQNLTGSGPLDWYLLSDISMEADLAGNASELVIGLRLVNGEIQIIDPASASDPDTDITSNSTLWKAIMPHGNDSGHDLVTPGTAGTIHYAYINSKVTIVGRALEPSEINANGHRTVLKDIVIDSSTIATVPAILYELGLAPLPGTDVEGGINVLTSGTCYALRGGGAETSPKGIADLDFSYVTGADQTRTFITSRSRARVES